MYLWYKRGGNPFTEQRVMFSKHSNTMDYSKYSVEDFILDERFRKWTIHPEKEDNLFWEDWLAKNPTRASDLKAAREILLNLSVREHKLGEAEVDALWQKIEDKIDATEEVAVGTKIIPINPQSILSRSIERRKPNYQWIRVASILLLLVVASLVWMKFDKPSGKTVATAENFVEKVTEPGMKSQITLRDGTLVMLNAGSKLRYLPAFSSASRDVYLEGEAFFDVAKDSKRPFNVYTGDVVTTAIGTAFNINSYQDRGNGISIALLEGKVSVKHASQQVDAASADEEEYLLLPGDKIQYEPQSKLFSLAQFDEREEIAWKDGSLLFAGAEAAEVFTRLERWYGVKVKFENASNKRLNYSAEFKNQNIHQVLTSLSFTLAFDYEIKDSQIFITYKNP